MSCQTTTTTAGIFLSAEAVIYNNLADTMSLSYGDYEADSPSEDALVNDLWEQAAAQGETVVVSAGDSGSDTRDQDATVATHGLNVSGLSSTAYNVSAGGTDFQDAYNQGLGDTAYQVSTFWSATNSTGDSSALSYVPETTWNDTCAGSLASYYVTASTVPTAFCDTANGYTNFRATGGGRRRHQHRQRAALLAERHRLRPALQPRVPPPARHLPLRLQRLLGTPARLLPVRRQHHRATVRGRHLFRSSATCRRLRAHQSKHRPAPGPAQLRPLHHGRH